MYKEQIEKRIGELEGELQNFQMTLNNYQKAMSNATDNILGVRGGLKALKELLKEDNDTDGKTDK